MAKRKRFQIVLNESPSLGTAATIYLDTQTGVLYLQTVNGYGGGLTPLLSADGTPEVWQLDKLPEDAP